MNRSPNSKKISHRFRRLVAGNWVAVLLVCLGTLTGCLSRPALNKQTFAFDVIPVSATNAQSSDRVLAIRTLQIAPPFEGRQLVYRTGENAYERDPHAEFLDAPTDQLLAEVREWWQVNGGFGAVVEADSALKPNLVVEITVTRLYGDFRQPERPLAVMSMRFMFFDAPHGIPGKLLLQQEYARSIPLSRPNATALVVGWNQALAEILSQVSSELKPATRDWEFPRDR